jgi:hypothetical protein
MIIEGRRKLKKTFREKCRNSLKKVIFQLTINRLVLFKLHTRWLYSVASYNCLIESEKETDQLIQMCKLRLVLCSTETRNTKFPNIIPPKKFTYPYKTGL